MRTETAPLPHGSLPLDLLTRKEAPVEASSVIRSEPGAASGASETSAEAAGPPALFGSVTGSCVRPKGAWTRAGMAALGVHALLFGAAIAMPTRQPAPVIPQEPELVFVQFSPEPASPPPALVAAAPAAQVAAVQPRPRPRPRPELVAPAEIPAPVSEPEEQVEVSVPTEVAQDTAALAASISGVASAAVSGMGIGGTDATGAGVSGGTGVGLLGDAPIPAAELAHPPRVLKQVTADYPRWARRGGITGRVVVRLIIDTEGRVEQDSVRVLRSIPELDDSALKAARGWRFSPGKTAARQRVRVMVDIPFQFSLR